MLSLLLSPFLLVRSPPIQIQANPRVAFIRQSVKLTIRISPHELNRGINLEWYFYEGFPDRKFFQVDGAQAHRPFEHWITLRDTGTLTARATLTRSDNTEYSAYTTITVPGDNDEGTQR